jgi:hypothetical protein
MIMGGIKVKKAHHTPTGVPNSEQSSRQVCIQSCDMFSTLKYFKSQSKNLYIIIENVYYRDAEPKVTINIIIKYLNIFKGGLGQKHETRPGTLCETAVGDDVEGVVGWCCCCCGGGVAV